MRSSPSRWKTCMVLLAAGALAGAAEAQTNQITDPGFEPVTTTNPFANTPWVPGDWNVEDADVVTAGAGAAAAIAPIDTQMLRINATVLTASQVTQIVDVTDLVAQDCCQTVADYSILVNAPAATTVTLLLSQGASLTGVGTVANATQVSVSITTDADTSTWEPLAGSVLLDPSTRYLEFQVSSVNAQIPTDGVFVDQGSVVLSTNLVTQGGFEQSTQLFAFTRSSGDPWIAGEWNAEDADVVANGSGAAAGIAPKNGIRMLRVNPGGGTASQVNQIIELGAPVSALDDTIGTWSVCVNAPAAVTVTLHMRAGDGQNVNVGTLTNATAELVALTTDADPDTWETIRGTRFLPAGTTHLEIQISAPVAGIPADGFFADCASVSLSPNRLADPGFEPGTALHAFFRVAGDPWIPGEWNAEDADVLAAPASGISPLSGSGMLRMNDSGDVGTQANQIIAVPETVYANGNTTATFAIWVNATAATTVTLTMRAGDGQTTVGTLTNATTDTAALVTDAMTGTWERIQGTLVLPAGTTHLELQISAPNAEVNGDGIFVDLTRVTLDVCELTASTPVPALRAPAVAVLTALLGVAGAAALRRRLA